MSRRGQIGLIRRTLIKRQVLSNHAAFDESLRGELVARGYERGNSFS